MRNWLPPHKYVVPIKAMFRLDPLPPELAETWHVLNAIAWVNKYEFTPPVSQRELIEVHFKANGKPLSRQALIERIARLEKLGWLTIDRAPGRESVYRPTIPMERPQQTAPRAEGTSVFSSPREADLARVNGPSDEMATLDTNAATCQVGMTGALDSTVIVVGTSSNSLKEFVQTTTITNNMSTAPRDERRTHSILERAGIVEPVLSELSAVVPWKTAMDWFLWIKYIQPRPKGRDGSDIAIPIAIKRLRQNPRVESPSSEAQFGKWIDELEHECNYGPRGESDGTPRHEREGHKWFYALYDGCPECGIELLPDPEEQTETKHVS